MGRTLRVCKTGGWLICNKMRKCIEILEVKEGNLPCLKKMELRKGCDYDEFGDILDHLPFETTHPVTGEVSYFVAVLRSSGLLLLWGYNFKKKECWLVDKLKTHPRQNEMALTLAIDPLKQYLVVHLARNVKKASRFLVYYFNENQLLKFVKELDVNLDNLGCFRALDFLRYKGRLRYLVGLSCEKKPKLVVYQLDGRNNEFREIEELKKELKASYTYKFIHVERGLLCSDYEGNRIEIKYKIL